MTFRHWIRWWAPAGLLAALRKRSQDTSGKVVSEMQVQSSLPRRSLIDLFPGIEMQNIAIPVQSFSNDDEYLLPIHEYLTLLSICQHRKPKRIFEFGTHIGMTTLGIAMNTPEDSEIFTLDLDASSRETHRHGLGVGGFPSFEVGATFRNSRFSGKIRQLFGDSQNFDFQPYFGIFDLIFIDADHSYDFVKSDTTNGLKLLRPGGMIVWDDYRWTERHPECAGVTKCVNEISATKQICELYPTRFAIYIAN